MNMDDLINLLVEVRVDLTFLSKSVNSEYIKEELKWAINGIDIVGCGLCQNISKKLKENLRDFNENSIKNQMLNHWSFIDGISRMITS